MELDPDWPIRKAAFEALELLKAVHGPELPSSAIEEGFKFNGSRIHFASRAVGIFKPKEMREGALSIRTVVPRAGRVARYDDLAEGVDTFTYRFERGGPTSRYNVQLRRAFELRAPLIYFFGIAEGLYAPLAPAFITAFDAGSLSCQVVIESTQASESGLRVADPKLLAIERRYSTVEVKRRLHQQAFRAQVLTAYRVRCAICNLPRRELLEASHIVPDHSPRGEPEVPNGLALCRLHHGAFDANLIGVRPDGLVEVSKRLLDEHDGPVLEHGLKGFNLRPVRMPREAELRPKHDYLEERYALFRKVGS